MAQDLLFKGGNFYYRGLRRKKPKPPLSARPRYDDREDANRLRVPPRRQPTPAPRRPSRVDPHFFGRGRPFDRDRLFDRDRPPEARPHIPTPPRRHTPDIWSPPSSGQGPDDYAVDRAVRGELGLAHPYHAGPYPTEPLRRYRFDQMLPTRGPVPFDMSAPVPGAMADPVQFVLESRRQQGEPNLTYEDVVRDMEHMSRTRGQVPLEELRVPVDRLSRFGRASQRPDVSHLITPPLSPDMAEWHASGGYSEPMTVAGRKGRFNFNVAPQPSSGGPGSTPGLRYLFETDDGNEYFFQLERQYQGGRWEDAGHAESDYRRYRSMLPSADVAAVDAPPPRRPPRGTKVFEGPKAQYRDLVEIHAEREGVDPNFVWALMNKESSFRPDVLAHDPNKKWKKGEQPVGLLQIKPTTANDYLHLSGIDPGFDLSDPETNIRIGIAHIARLQNNLGTTDPEALTLAYHAGQGNYQKFARGETDHGVGPKSHRHADGVVGQMDQDRLAGQIFNIPSRAGLPEAPAGRPRDGARSDELRAVLDDAWGPNDPIAATIYSAALGDVSFDELQKRLEPFNTWRQVSDATVAHDDDGHPIDLSRPVVVDPVTGENQTERTIGVYGHELREFVPDLAVDPKRIYNIPSIWNGQMYGDSPDARMRAAQHMRDTGWQYPNFATPEEANEAAGRRSAKIGEVRGGGAGARRFAAGMAVPGTRRIPGPVDMFAPDREGEAKRLVHPEGPATADQQAQVGRFLEDARGAIAEGRPQDGFRALANVFQIHPGHGEAIALEQQIRSRIERDEADLATMGERFKGGVEKSKMLGTSFVEATGEATGLEMLSEWGRKGRELSTAEIAKLPPMQSVFDEEGNLDLSPFDSIPKIARYVRDLILDQAPIMAPMFAGAATGAKIGLLGGPKGVVLGATIGALFPSFVMGVGETQSEIKQKDPSAVAPTYAFVGGTAIAALDSVLPYQVSKFLVQRFGRVAAEEIAKRTLLTPVRQGFKGSATEAVTEALQGSISAVASDLATDRPIDWAAAARQAVDEGMAGGVLGGLIGSGGSLVAVSREEIAFDSMRQQAQQKADEIIREEPLEIGTANEFALVTTRIRNLEQQLADEKTPDAAKPGLEALLQNTTNARDRIIERAETELAERRATDARKQAEIDTQAQADVAEWRRKAERGLETGEAGVEEVVIEETLPPVEEEVEVEAEDVETASPVRQSVSDAIVSIENDFAVFGPARLVKQLNDILTRDVQAAEDVEDTGAVWDSTHGLTLPQHVVDRNTKLATAKARIDSTIEQAQKRGATPKSIQALQAASDQIASTMEAEGFEVVDLLGQRYRDGMELITRSREDDTLPVGQEIITRIIKPPVNYQGKMIQAGEVEISVGTKPVEEAAGEVSEGADEVWPDGPGGRVAQAYKRIRDAGEVDGHEAIVKKLTDEAEAGTSDMQFELGRAFLSDENLKRHRSEAVPLLLRAADQGHLKAQITLADAYYGGRSVEENLPEAFRYFRLAAEQGDASAQHMVGSMYADGEGVKQDNREAVRWYKLAADQGIASAQKALAELEGAAETETEEEKKTEFEVEIRSDDAVKELEQEVDSFRSVRDLHPDADPEYEVMEHLVEYGPRSAVLAEKLYQIAGPDRILEAMKRTDRQIDSDTGLKEADWNEDRIKSDVLDVVRKAHESVFGDGRVHASFTDGEEVILKGLADQFYDILEEKYFEGVDYAERATERETGDGPTEPEDSGVLEDEQATDDVGVAGDRRTGVASEQDSETIDPPDAPVDERGVDGEGGPGVRRDELDELKQEGPQNISLLGDEAPDQRSKQQRVDDNIEAIRVLNILDSERRAPTREEQAILAKYVGWGGISPELEALLTDNAYTLRRKDRSRAFKLKKSLKDDALDQLKASVRTSFYTPAPVVRAIYDALLDLGLTGNVIKILEPSAGVGNFIGLLPDELAHANVTGVEIDDTTARIAKKLYRGHTIYHKSFEKAPLAPNSFDVVVGNVPFSDAEGAPTGDWRTTVPSDVKHLHNHFILHALDKVRPNGLVALIVPTSTLNGMTSQSARQAIADKANFLGAIRLPESTFEKTAGTKTATDILFLQKRAPGEEAQHVAPWIETVDRDIEGKKGDARVVISKPVNEYFSQNPQRIIGQETLGGQYQNAYTVEFTGDLSRELPDRLRSMVQQAQAAPEATDPTRIDVDAELNLDEFEDEFFGMPESGTTVGKITAMPERGESVADRAQALRQKLDAAIEKVRNSVDRNVDLTAAETAASEAVTNFTEGNEVEFKARIQEVKDALKAAQTTATRPSRSVYQEDDRTRPPSTTVAVSGAPTVEEVPVGSYFLSDSVLLQRDPSGDLVKATFPEQTPRQRNQSKDKRDRLTLLLPLKDAVTRQIALENNPSSTTKDIEAHRTKLRGQYDAYINRFPPKDGPPRLATRETEQAIGEDTKLYALIMGLDQYKEKTQTVTPAPMFSERTIFPYEAPDTAQTPQDAMVISLGERGRLDMPFMSKLMDGRSADDIAKVLLDQELVFENPVGGAVDRLVMKEAYLSGDVKTKLDQARAAASTDKRYQRNVTALEDVQPPDYSIQDLRDSTRLGENWIKPETYREWLIELLEGKGYLDESDIKFTYYPEPRGEWHTWFSRHVKNSQKNTDLGTNDKTALKLLDAMLNQKPIRVTDENKQLDQERTQMALAAAENLETHFRDWLFSEERGEEMAALFNETLNREVERKYDGSHLEFPGQAILDPSKDRKDQLREHQRNAIWRVLSSPESTLLAHVVGSGKTYTLIGSAMELRRLGLAKKPLIVTPKATMKQFAEDFFKLYPGANVLFSTPETFEKDHRPQFLTRIATGNWDAVIITKEQMKKIVPSDAIIEEVYDERLNTSLEQLRLLREERGNAPSLKELEKHIAVIRHKKQQALDKAKKSRDEGVPLFDDLGVDALLVDEAHYHKKPSIPTQLTAKGIPDASKPSDMAEDLMAKVSYIRKQAAGRNVVFATGTPVTNSLAELFVMQKYLQPELLKRYNINAFDAWVRQFANVSTDVEQTSKGAYESVERMRSFKNVRLLSRLWRQVADVKLERDLPYLKLPKVKKHVDETTGELVEKPEAVPVSASEEYLDYVDWLADRAEQLGEKPEPYYEEYRLGGPAGERAEVHDNLLLITTHGRLASVDMRLVNDEAGIQGRGDQENSKVAKAADRIFEIYERTTKDKGAQVVFSDIGTPRPRSKTTKIAEKPAEAEGADVALDEFSTSSEIASETDWSVYDGIKDLLVKKGIPEDEIQFVHDWDSTPAEKQKLFERVNDGDVRVVIGSTPKLGTGANIQERLVALHHIDVPWRPADLMQRNGRIIRQGNVLAEKYGDKFEVEILVYLHSSKDPKTGEPIEGTGFDEYMWNTISTKARGIDQIMTGEADAVEDTFGEFQLSADEMRALSAADESLVEWMHLRPEIQKLEAKRSVAKEKQARSARRLKDLPSIIEGMEEDLAYESGGIALARDPKKKEQFSASIGEEEFTEPKAFGVALKKAAMDVTENSSRPIATIKGIEPARGEKELGPFAGEAQPDRLTITAAFAGRNQEGDPTWSIKSFGTIPVPYKAADRPRWRLGYTVIRDERNLPTPYFIDKKTDPLALARQVELHRTTVDKRIKAVEEELQNRKAQLASAESDIADSQWTAEDEADYNFKQTRVRLLAADLATKPRLKRERRLPLRTEGPIRPLASERKKTRPTDGPPGVSGMPIRAEDNPYEEGTEEHDQWEADKAQTVAAFGDEPVPDASEAAKQMEIPVTNMRENSPQRIAHKVAEAIGEVPITVGKQGAGFLGTFWETAQGIRLKISADFETMFHENGHALDLIITRWSDANQKGLKEGDPAYKELLEAGAATSKPSYTVEQRRKEGTAEYLRIWMLDPDFARKQYPAFTKIFEDFIRDTNEPVGQVLAQGQEQIQQYFAASAMKRLEAHVDFRDPSALARVGFAANRVGAWMKGTRDDRRTAISRLVSSMNDDLYRLWEMEIDLKGSTLDMGTSVYWLHRLLAGTAGQADQFLEHGPTDPTGRLFGQPEDKKTGTGMNSWLQPIVNKGEQAYKNFNMALIARRARVYHRLGMPSGLTQDMIEAGMKLLKDPDIKAAVDGFDDFTAAMRDYMEERGFLPPEVRELWEKTWADEDTGRHVWVPFHRIQGSSMQEAWAHSERSKRPGSGKIKKQPTKIRSMKKVVGSYETIADPMRSLVEDVFEQVRATEDNYARYELIQLLKGKGAAKWGEIMPPDKHPTKIWLNEGEVRREVKAVVETVVGELTGDSKIAWGDMLKKHPNLFQAAAEVWRPATLVQEGQRYLTALGPDGKRVWARILDDGLWEMVDRKPSASGMIRGLSKAAAGLVRSTATMNLPYMLSNIARDFVTAKMYSPAGLTFTGLMKGWKSYAAGDETWRRFMASRAAQSSFISQDVDLMKRRMNQMDKTTLRKFMESTIFHPIDFLRAMREMTEVATRLGVQRANLEAAGFSTGDYVPEAIAQRLAVLARESTQDFNKMGSEIRPLNQHIAFLGATIGGYTRAGQEILDPKRRGVLAGRMMMYMGFSVALWALNQDEPEYDEIEGWEKNSYHHFPIWRLAELAGGPAAKKALQDRGVGPFVRIRRPFEFGDAANVIEAFLTWATTNDDTFRDRLSGLKTTGEIDYRGVAQMLLGVTPDIFLPVLEIQANYDFFRGRRIVSPYAPGDPSLQYNRWTSDTAKIIGRQLNMSPAKIDHFIYGYTTGVGRAAVSGLDRLMGYRTASPAEETPFGEFGVRAFYGGYAVGRASLDRFYERKQQIDGAVNTINTLLRTGVPEDNRRAIEVAKDNGLQIRRSRTSSGSRRTTVGSPERTRLNRAETEISVLRSSYNNVFENQQMSPDEKRTALDKLVYRQISAARRALGRPALDRP